MKQRRPGAVCSVGQPEGRRDRRASERHPVRLFVSRVVVDYKKTGCECENESFVSPSIRSAHGSRRLSFAQGTSHVTLRQVDNRKTAEAMGGRAAVAKLAPRVDSDWRRGCGRISYPGSITTGRSSDKCLDCRSRSRDIARRKTRRASTSVSSSNSFDIN